MQKIKFKTIEFELVNPPSVLADRLSLTVIKGDAPIDTLLYETSDIDVILVTENDKIVSAYKGYNKLFALTLIMSEDVPTDRQQVSIELQNTNLQAQVNKLFSTVHDLQARTIEQDIQLNTINEQVEEITSVHSSALDDIGTELSQLAEAQETQNKAIEDLGSVLSDMMESEDVE